MYETLKVVRKISKTNQRQEYFLSNLAEAFDFKLYIYLNFKRQSFGLIHTQMPLSSAFVFFVVPDYFLFKLQRTELWSHTHTNATWLCSLKNK